MTSISCSPTSGPTSHGRGLPGVDRHDLFADPIRVAISTSHPAARAHPQVVRLQDLAAEPWVSSEPGIGWNEVTVRTCREHGQFEPDIRHRTTDAIVALRLVAYGLAVMLLPELISIDRHPGVTLREVSDASLTRQIFAATRTADAARPSVAALLDAVRTACVHGTAPSHGGASDRTV